MKQNAPAATLGTVSDEAANGLVARIGHASERDPFRFLEAHRGRPRFLYASPAGVIAGAGIAMDVRAEGPERFREIRSRAQRLLGGLRREHGPGVPTDFGPAWMGGFGFEADLAQPDDFPPARFVLPSEQLQLVGAQAYVTRIGTLPPAVPRKPPNPALEPAWKAEPTEEEWTRRVRTVLHDIQQGNLEKIVLARTRSTRAPGLDPVTALRRLSLTAPSSRLFLFEFTPGNAWFGASPEPLVRRSHGRLHTLALAGSRPRGRTPEEDLAYERSLRASSKEAWEHELVCRFLRGVLSEGGRTWTQTLDRHVLKLPNVQHLESRFEADSGPEEHVLDVAARLHPTPAVSGAPREAALEILSRIENRARGWYAGAIGTFDEHGDGELAVGIRCARLVDEAVTVWAGSGIVSGSDPSEEWEESRHKFNLLVRALEGAGP